MEDQMYDELLVELECPICTNYMSPPIRQCATGHSICEACTKRLPKCALCQGRFTDSRNIALESLAVKMRYPCINKNAGCMVRLAYTDRETHELRCGLKVYKCPIEKCTWTGRLEEIASHWASKKMTSKPYKKCNVCHSKMKNESYYVNMLEAYDMLFWFKCKLTKNKIYWAVQLIGNSAEAENYYYEIEIIKPGQAKKKILISDYCQSIELENSQLFKDDACTSINTESIMNFVGGDQLLIYYLRVFEINGDNLNNNQQPMASALLPNTTSINKPLKAQQKPRTKNSQDKKPKNQSKGPHAKETQKKDGSGFVLL